MKTKVPKKKRNVVEMKEKLKHENFRKKAYLLFHVLPYSN